MPVENLVIDDIIVKCIRQEELSPEENAFLEQWLTQGASRETFHQLSDASSLEQDLTQFYLLNKKKDAARNKLVEKFFAGQPVVPITAHKKTSTFKLLMAAAIMIPVLALGGWYFIFNTPKKEVAQVKTTQPVYDVQPGSDKATLTLADGSKIVLDNTGNGLVTEQGTTKVVKMASGELVYQPSGSASPVEYNTLNVPRSGKHILQLPDGSKVWLNAASSIKYYTSFNGDARKVEITGECYFEIKPIYKKPGVKLPFLVTINTPDGDTKGEIEVLGTHFNVKAYSDEPVIQTTLLEGSVKMSVVSARPDDPVGRGQSSVLKPGQQAELTHNSQPAYRSGRLTTHDADVEQAMAWRNEMIWFEKADIRTIMREISRAYDVDVQYVGKITASDFHFKIFKTMMLSKVLGALEETIGKSSPLHFTITADKKVIVSDK